MKSFLRRVLNYLKYKYAYFKRKYAANILFSYYANRARFFKKYNSKKVILLRLDLIGDCTMFTSAAKEICDYYHDREITVVCLSISKPVFERLGCFDKIITLDFRPSEIQYKELLLLIHKLRKDKYDTLLQPQCSKTPVVDLIAAAVRCNQRITIETKPGNSAQEWIDKVNPLYDQIIPYPRGNVSEFDYYAAFVRGVCDPNYKTVCPSLPYRQQNIIEGDYYVLYPGGSIRQKFWPQEYYARIAEHIYHETGLTGVLLGVADEQWVADKIAEHIHFPASTSLLDLTGKTTISDVIDIIGNARLVVTNDTSGVHIACATKTPSVVIVGGWHYDRFLPYHIENVKADDCLPLVANTPMPCYHCDYNVERENPKCLERLKAGELSICIEKVTYKQVEELVDRILKSTR